MEYKKVFKGKKEKFEGYVLIKIPSYLERMDMLKNSGIKLGKDGSYEVDESTFDTLKQMAMIAQKHCISMELIHKTSNKRFSKLEELEMYSEYQEIVNVVFETCIQGESLGN